MDVEKYRYQKFISDIAGQDIHAHGGDPSRAIGVVRNWLASSDKSKKYPGQDAVSADYAKYLSYLPKICNAMKWSVSKLTFNDKVNAMQLWQRIG